MCVALINVNYLDSPGGEAYYFRCLLGIRYLSPSCDSKQYTQWEEMQLLQKPSVQFLKIMQIRCRTGCSTPKIARPACVHHTKSNSQSLKKKKMAQRSLLFHFPLYTFGQGNCFIRCLYGAQPNGLGVSVCTVSAQIINKNCPGWDHTRGWCQIQEQTPELWRSQLQFYLLSNTSFCGRAKISEGCLLQSTAEVIKPDRFIPIEESGSYSFVINKLQNLDLFHALPHTHRFIQIHQPRQHLSRWLPFNQGFIG